MLLLALCLSVGAYVAPVIDDQNYFLADDAISESMSEEIQEEPEEDGLTPGAIAGIVIACVIVVAIIAVLIWFFVTKNKNQSVSTESSNENI